MYSAQTLLKLHWLSWNRFLDIPMKYCSTSSSLREKLPLLVYLWIRVPCRNLKRISIPLTLILGDFLRSSSNESSWYYFLTFSKEQCGMTSTRMSSHLYQAYKIKAIILQANYRRLTNCYRVQRTSQHSWNWPAKPILISKITF